MRPAFLLVAALAAVAAQAQGPVRPRKARPAKLLIQVPARESILASLRPGHPRLLADAARFELLKRRCASDATVSSWYKKARSQAAELLAAAPCEYVIPDGKRLLATSREVLRRVQLLAFLYRIEGDAVWARRAWDELANAAAYKDWNPKHFLDTAEMTHAFALGYDWLYDWLSPDQRRTLRTAIVTLGLQPGLKVYRSRGGWPTATHNWNQVCNGGLGMGALAIADEEPEVAAEVLHAAVTSMPRAVASYGPDGAWAEGPGYWQYATAYTVAFMAGLNSALGTDFGLSGIAGFPKSGLFPIHASGIGSVVFDYADAHAGVIRAPEMWWLANRFRNPLYAFYAARHASGTPLDMLWYEPSLSGARPARAPLSVRFRGAEIACLRTSWTDPDAGWLGVKGGDNRANHSHLDLGSFVMEAQGVRWAVELGADDYNLPAYFGARRWTYYRLRAEGHATIVYGPGSGPDQDPSAVAPITRFKGGGSPLAVLDLSRAYRTSVRSAHRGFRLVEPGLVVVQDEMEADAPTDAWWFMPTRAQVDVASDGRSARLTQQGKALTVRIGEGCPGSIAVMPCLPLPGSPSPAGQQANAGYRKLAIHLPAVTSLRLAVELDARNGPLAELRPVRPLADW